MEKGLVSIDRWGVESQAYFLTHLHADHTVGLSSKWRKGPLFCSPVTRSLFPSRFPGFDLELIRVLEVGSTTPLSLVSLSDGSEQEMLVTVVDAGHCPGAVMYLFRGDFGCVLYTGDFRWELGSERAQLGKKTLLKALRDDNVDILYLDNTYCNPAFSFPPRNVAAKEIIDIIAQHPEHEVIIGIDTLGKEDLLLQIAEALNIKIWVWPERLQTVHLLGFFDVFTTKTCLTRVRAVPRYNLTFNTLEVLNSLHPTIGILPSGLPWLDPNFDSTCTEQNFYSVRYSDHSCFKEIQEFIDIVKPTTVTGIVTSSSCDINPRHYFLCHGGDSYQSYRSCSEFESEMSERKAAKQCGSLRRRGSSEKLKSTREKKIKFASSSVRRSRIRILRKNNRGAKIADC